MKFQKKPVIIEAFRIGWDHIPDWFAGALQHEVATLNLGIHGYYHHPDTTADIKTLEGMMHASNGDYIIQGIDGELYPCKPDIFEKTYERVGCPHECD